MSKLTYTVLQQDGELGDLRFSHLENIRTPMPMAARVPPTSSVVVVRMNTGACTSSTTATLNSRMKGN
ncbi:hypothetical protein V5799_004156 [Amblyomma americanum]|uniref:Uncharacterized protein n=1 Tax=Amblyomma americanum TaxID=6943 RepID=A0AAQ4D6X2_AMBAM